MGDRAERDRAGRGGWGIERSGTGRGGAVESGVAARFREYVRVRLRLVFAVYL